MSATATLARFVANTRYDDIPADVVERAKVAILDGVANLLAGSQQPVGKIVAAYVKEMGGAGDCTVVGHGFKTSPPFAAFANGVFGHCLDYEIQGQPASHGTSSILPGALALAERHGGSGKDVIAAYTVGWDIQQRIRTAGAKANLRGFHPPGVFGPPAAASAASVILGLDEQQVRVALGIACSRTGGLFANNGTMVKSTHPGNAGRVGTEAALLAKAGFTANESILEAHQGYVGALFGEDFDYDVLVQNLGEQFHIKDPGFNIKRYPAEIFMQWAINAVADMRDEHSLKLEDVNWLELEVPMLHAGATISRPRPASGLDGKFSLEYCAAIGLVEPQVGIDSFSDETCFSAPVQAALDKIRLKENPEIPREQSQFRITARAELVDGRTVENTCRHFRGSIANPMTRDEHLVKYRDCAKRVLSEADGERVRELVENLEDVTDIRELVGIWANG